MKNMHVRVDPRDPATLPMGRVDHDRLDATSDEMIADQARRDDEEDMREMGLYVRRIRSRVGMSQVEFAGAIGVSVDTLRNWEQGRRYPTATARALLKVVAMSPETALAALRR